MFIKAEMKKEEKPWYKESSSLRHGFIPIVLESDHPRFVPGTRFDYGFLQIALDEGYDIEITHGDVKRVAAPR